MSQKKIFFFLFFFSCSFVFSQQSISLSGKIKFENGFLPGALLELQIHKNSKFSISNENGYYKFSPVNCVLNDTVILKVNYLGYKNFIKLIVISQENMIFDVDIENVPVLDLEEVVIMSDSKIMRSSGKSTYKINQKNFIKNTKATEVLATIPNVYCNKESGKTIVDGNLEGKIFIDGIEAMPNEIKSIKASSIYKIEILSNPSSSYGTEFLGAIVNIVTKKTTEQFFKGSIGVTGGVRNNYGVITPSVVYKKGILNFKSEIQYLQNDQISTDVITRNDLNGNYIQDFENNSKTIQKYANSRLGLKFSEKSDLTLIGYIGSYNTKGNIVGTFINNSETGDYANLNKTINNDLEIASVYNHKINEKKTFSFKNKYAVISDFYSSEYTNQVINYFDIKSKIKEFASSLSYDIEDLKFLKKPTTIDYNLKYINRNYSFSDTDFYVNQNVFNATFEMNNDWSKKISTKFSFTFEHSNNKSDTFLKNYNLILPTFNALYHFKNKVDVSFGYSKKVLRPNPSDLNAVLIISSPGSGRQGNPNLEQQIRNYYSFRINKDYESDNISIKFHTASINNSIVNIYKKQGDLLIKTLDNAAKFNSSGIDLGYSTKILKKIGLNIDSGINYNVYKTDNNLALIKKNEGVSFNSSIYIYTNMFKDKVAVSLSGDYSGPDYSLLSKTISYPYLDFSISSNLFKEKLALSLYVQNLLGDYATISKETSYGDNFQQSHSSRNNFTNLLLTLTYNFGKKFDDNLNDDNLENNDIRK